jgi:hypothetical protein
MDTATSSELIAVVDRHIEIFRHRQLVSQVEVIDPLLDLRAVVDEEIQQRIDTHLRDFGSGPLQSAGDVVDAFLELRLMLN